MAVNSSKKTKQVEVFFHTQQPYVHVKEEDLDKYPAGRLLFPNTYFEPQKAHELYNMYHEQYAFADEVGFDGIMTNEHHSCYWNMKPSANLDAAVISKVTSRAKIAILGNILPITDPVRMAEELAMLDLYSGGKADLWVCKRRRPRDPPSGVRPHREPGAVRRGP